MFAPAQVGECDSYPPSPRVLTEGELIEIDSLLEQAEANATPGHKRPFWEAVEGSFEMASDNDDEHGNEATVNSCSPKRRRVYVEEFKRFGE